MWQTCKSSQRLAHSWHCWQQVSCIEVVLVYSLTTVVIHTISRTAQIKRNDSLSLL